MSIVNAHLNQRLDEASTAIHLAQTTIPRRGDRRLRESRQLLVAEQHELAVQIQRLIGDWRGLDRAMYSTAQVMPRRPGDSS